MRVLQANKFHYRRAGAEAYYFEVSELLRRKGHTVLPFAMVHPSNEPAPTERYFAPEVDYHAAPGPKQALAAAALIWNPLAARRLRALLRAEPAEVAHLHNIYHQLSPSILPPLKDAGLRVVMSMHDLKLLCPNYKMFVAGRVCERCKGGRFSACVAQRCSGSLSRSVLAATEMHLHARSGVYRRYLDLVIAPSRFYRDKLLEWGWSPSQVTQQYYCINLGEPLRRDGREAYAAYFGRLAPEKGLHTLLRAAQRHPGIELRVAGDGPEGEALRQTPPSNVHFVGRLEGEALRRFVAEARFTVCPSEWYENCPFAVIESQAQARPVLGARIGGIPELIDAGRSGQLFASGDIDALAEGLEAMWALSDAELDAMGAEGRAAAEARHDPEAHYETLMAHYR